MTDKEKVDAAVQQRINAGWPAQLKRRIREHMERRRRAQRTTMRTKQTTASLKNAGLTEDELKRLRGE